MHTIEHLNQRKLRILSAVSFVLSMSTAFLVYLESKYLETLIGKDYWGLVFFASYGITLIILDQLPRLIDRFGKTKIMLVLLTAVIASLSVIAKYPSAPWIVLPFFALYLVSSALVSIVLDFFVEMYSTDAMTGTVRGAYLTIVNAGWVITPFAAFWVHRHYGFSPMFAIAALLTVPVFLVFAYGFKHQPDGIRHRTNFWTTLARIFSHRELSHIFIISFVLQFFYAWMVFYTPLHLDALGFSEGDIGKIFSIMLVAFVIVQYPAGMLADRKLGEKQLTIAGLIIMGFATIALYFTHSTQFLVWAGLLFTTRIGAALIEVMRDTYFFKQIDYRDLELISFFRNTGPLAYMLGPLVATGILLFTGKQTLFLILGIIVLGTLFFAARLKDTK